MDNSSEELTQYPISPDIVKIPPKTHFKPSLLTMPAKNGTNTLLKHHRLRTNQEDLLHFPLIASTAHATSSSTPAADLINQDYSLLQSLTAETKPASAGAATSSSSKTSSQNTSCEKANESNNSSNNSSLNSNNSSSNLNS